MVKIEQNVFIAVQLSKETQLEHVQLLPLDGPLGGYSYKCKMQVQ